MKSYRYGNKSYYGSFLELETYSVLSLNEISLLVVEEISKLETWSPSINNFNKIFLSTSIYSAKYFEEHNEFEIEDYSATNSSEVVTWKEDYSYEPYYYLVFSIIS